MELVIIAGAAALIYIFYAYLQRSRTKIQCPNCQSPELRKLDEELKELKQDATAGYAIKLDVKLIMETQYRCLACEHKWSVTAPEK